MKKDVKIFIDHILESIKSIHQYFGIDLELTWETIKVDIPKLREYMLKINKLM